jgi:hypothetical protein
LGSATITLTTGTQFVIYYSWTFGEMGIVALLLALDVVYVARWIYDVVLQLWAIRGGEESDSA